MSGSDHVDVARDGGVITLRLNRPDEGDAISLELARQRQSAVLELEPS